MLTHWGASIHKDHAAAHRIVVDAVLLASLPGIALALALAQLPTPALAQSNALASTVTVEGVAYEREIPLAGSALKLNGAGIRSKFVFKVYAAGFYLTRKADTPEAVLGAPGPKRISVTMLRDIE